MTENTGDAVTGIPCDDQRQTIQGVYSTPRANSPIELYAGPMVVALDEDQISGHGSLSLDWLPSPRIRFEMHTPKEPCRDTKLALSSFLKPDCKCTVEMLDAGPALSACNVSAGHIANSELQISGTVNEKVFFGTDSKLSSLIFHLVNAPQLLLSPDGFVLQRGMSARSWDRIVLRREPWLVTLDPVENDGDLRNEAIATRGYAITRVGKIERTDGKMFSLEDVQIVLEKLKHVFSFAFERWCPPTLLVGLGADQQRVCTLVTPSRIGRFQGHLGWFDFHHPGTLGDLFTGIWERWQDEQCREALEDAIYWFIEIHREPIHIETGIVLGQITLEMLGWLLLVETAPIISSDGFGKLAAADKLALLLSRCSIPINVPPELSALAKLAKGLNWRGSDACVNVRNWIVHANRKNRGRVKQHKIASDELWDAHCLGCWYVELVLLHMLGYQGKYSKRMANGRWVGLVESVPWARASEALPKAAQ